MRRSLLVAVTMLAWSATALLGCASRTVPGWDAAQLAELGKAQQRNRAGVDGRMDDMLAKQKFTMEFASEPDLPDWHAQREKMALAIGDRSFDEPFERVFDSMTVALATLGSRVNNMERSSGYLSASIPGLGPTRTAAMHKTALRQYAAARGYPASIFDRSDEHFDLDIESTSHMMTRGMAGMTLSLVRQGKKRTKVKLRFDNVFYPELVAEYYKVVWSAVDKQMFLDHSLD